MSIVSVALKKFLSERIMNAAQAHNNQVGKEFSNIKDTYIRRYSEISTSIRE